MSNPAISGFKNRTIIIALVGAIVGLLMLLASGRLEDVFWKGFLSSLASVLLISGLTSFLYEFFVRSEFIDIIKNELNSINDRLNLNRGEDDVGLVRVDSDSGHYDFSKILESDGDISIVLNDGRTWISTRSEPLKARFTRPAKTTFILLDPSSEGVALMAKKQGTSAPAIKHKIAEAIRMIKEYGGNSDKVTIVGHDLFNPYSLFISSELAVITPYFASKGRRPVPAFFFEKGVSRKYYDELSDDLSILIAGSRDISTFEFDLTE
ncbi:hypothetical protein [Brevundimonas sp.]|uniref:hypothetical protein n=1 Tax=Brevundimonas sp. TaxID=1871086 RepID=UPI002FDAFCF3